MPTLTAKPKPTYPDLGEYCTYEQAIYSSTAVRLGLANVPTIEQYGNMVQVHDTVIVPVVEHFGVVPSINSFFRSSVLVKKGGKWMSVNSAVGGSKTSDHPHGRAVDLSYRWIKNAPTNLDLFRFLRDVVDLDQLILEYADENGLPQWCHAGQRGEANRHQVFSAIKDKNGKPKYV